jgi:hypothetical protein
VLLGPLMPVGRVTVESFATFADTFVKGCSGLMDETAKHWEMKTTEVHERALKMEASISRETKKSLRQDVDELTQKTEKTMQLLQS